MAIRVELKQIRVYPLWKEEVFRDIARIPATVRGTIREGSICKISTNGCAKELIVRGLVDTLSDGIMLDEYTRRTLGNIEEGMRYDFVIEEVGVVGRLKWACTVADPGARISAWIGILSLALGILGIVLGVLSLCLALK